MSLAASFTQTRVTAASSENDLSNCITQHVCFTAASVLLKIIIGPLAVAPRRLPSFTAPLHGALSHGHESPSSKAQQVYVITVGDEPIPFEPHCLLNVTFA